MNLLPFENSFTKHREHMRFCLMFLAVTGNKNNY